MQRFLPSPVLRAGVGPQAAPFRVRPDAGPGQSHFRSRMCSPPGQADQGRSLPSRRQGDGASATPVSPALPGGFPAPIRRTDPSGAGVQSVDRPVVKMYRDTVDPGPTLGRPVTTRQEQGSADRYRGDAEADS